MTAPLRLPIAPRPFRNELLSSWMARVATRYGMETPAMTAWLAGQRRDPRSPRLVDDIAPNPDLLRLCARACRVDPARLHRLSLASRYPERPRQWLLERPGVPVCLGFFDADVTVGRDSYLRSEWMLAGHVACPIHGEMLCDRCPVCSGRLQVSFQFRSALLRPFCRKYGALLIGRGGEKLRVSETDFAMGVLELQREVRKIVKGDGDRRMRLEQAIRSLWAPLDRQGAARPVLALWFDQPGWNCPFEVRGAVSTDAPLQHLSVCWRALTLVALGDLFGAELEFNTEMTEAARRLFGRAAQSFLAVIAGGRHRSGKRTLLNARQEESTD